VTSASFLVATRDQWVEVGAGLRRMLVSRGPDPDDSDRSEISHGGDDCPPFCPALRSLTLRAALPAYAAGLVGSGCISSIVDGGQNLNSLTLAVDGIPWPLDRAAADDPGVKWEDHLDEVEHLRVENNLTQLLTLALGAASKHVWPVLHSLAKRVKSLRCLTLDGRGRQVYLPGGYARLSRLTRLDVGQAKVVTTQEVDTALAPRPGGRAAMVEQVAATFATSLLEVALPPPPPPPRRPPVPYAFLGACTRVTRLELAASVPTVGPDQLRSLRTVPDAVGAMSSLVSLSCTVRPGTDRDLRADNERRPPWREIALTVPGRLTRLTSLTFSRTNASSIKFSNHRPGGALGSLEVLDLRDEDLASMPIRERSLGGLRVLRLGRVPVALPARMGAAADIPPGAMPAPFSIIDFAIPARGWPELTEIVFSDVNLTLGAATVKQKAVNMPRGVGVTPDERARHLACMMAGTTAPNLRDVHLVNVATADRALVRLFNDGRLKEAYEVAGRGPLEGRGRLKVHGHVRGVAEPAPVPMAE